MLVTAGLVSGPISAPMPTSPWRGDQAVPTGFESEPPHGGSIHASAPVTPPRPVHRPRRPRSSSAASPRPRPTLGDRLFILGHHYQRDEVMRWADARGDSYRLSVLAQQRPAAEYIVFCGVHFMAESADVLTEDHQQVILPDLNAGCSMADMADIDEVEQAWEELGAVIDVEQLVPITYMNSSAALKAFVGEHGGAVCTSTNARAVLEWALGRGRQGPVLPRPAPRPQHRAGHGLRPRRHAGVEPALRARAASPRPTARTPRSCCGRATARSTSGSGPSTSRPSGPSTPTAS